MSGGEILKCGRCGSPINIYPPSDGREYQIELHFHATVIPDPIHGCFRTGEKVPCSWSSREVDVIVDAADGKGGWIESVKPLLKDDLHEGGGIEGGKMAFVNFLYRWFPRHWLKNLRHAWHDITGGVGKERDIAYLGHLPGKHLGADGGIDHGQEGSRTDFDYGSAGARCSGAQLPHAASAMGAGDCDGDKVSASL